MHEPICPTCSWWCDKTGLRDQARDLPSVRKRHLVGLDFLVFVWSHLHDHRRIMQARRGRGAKLEWQNTRRHRVLVDLKQLDRFRRPSFELRYSHHPENVGQAGLHFIVLLGQYPSRFIFRSIGIQRLTPLKVNERRRRLVRRRHSSLLHRQAARLLLRLSLRERRIEQAAR